jgi:hypothetical protein
MIPTTEDKPDAPRSADLLAHTDIFLFSDEARAADIAALYARHT